MSYTSTKYQKPAILGGSPVFSTPLRVTGPSVDEATAQAIVDLYRSGSWSWNGKWERRAAELLAKIHTARHAMLLANGTVTLEAALYALGVGPGDEVIVPALTWIATAAAVIYVGATPVFVDIESDTLCLDVKQAAEAITSKTKAIIPVHLYGSMANMDAIMKLAHKHGLKVVEDCAHAHGGLWDGKGVGSIGDAGSFSFQQSKTVAAGEGGALITNDDALAVRLYQYKHIGYAPQANQGETLEAAPPLGFICHNYRATEFQGITICPQLEKLEEKTRRRNRNANFLTEHLEKIPGLKVQKRGLKADPERQGYYSFIIKYDPAEWSHISCNSFKSALQAEGLSHAGGTYGTVYRHTLWSVPTDRYRIHGDWSDEKGKGCRVSEEIGTHRSIGLTHGYLDMDAENIQKIVDIFQKLHSSASTLTL